MDDQELIDMIAQIWVIGGGDSSGFQLYQGQIKSRIEEIEWVKDEQ